MKKYFVALYALAVLLLIGCQSGTDNPQADETPAPLEVTDVSYNSSHPECVMDIYRQDNQVRPAIILIHGGAWLTIKIDENTSYDAQMGLDRVHMEGYAYYFQEKGYHAVNIDYRRVNIVNPDGTNYKDMLDDIKSAISFLKKNSKRYKIDTSKIILYGYSAGAHLAELYSYKVTNSPIPVKLCIAKSGPADFWNDGFRNSSLGGFARFPGAAALLGLPSNASYSKIAKAFRLRLMTNLLGISADETSDLDNIINDENNKAVIDDISPIYHVKASSPRTILLHGEIDDIVPYSVAVSLDEKLTECGVAHDFITMPNSDHSLNNSQDSAKLEEFNQTVLTALQSL